MQNRIITCLVCHLASSMELKPWQQDLFDLMKNHAVLFSLKMARVDRYESKLRLMAFMGIYQELTVSLQPVRLAFCAFMLTLLFSIP